MYDPILPLGDSVSAWVVKHLGTEKLIRHANFPIRPLDFCHRDMFGDSIPFVEFCGKLIHLARKLLGALTPECLGRSLGIRPLIQTEHWPVRFIPHIPHPDDSETKLAR